MSFWNKPVTDRQWEKGWGKIALGVYVAAIYYTCITPRYRLFGIGLLGLGLGRILTELQYAEKSKTKFFYLGEWYDSLGELHRDLRF